MSYNFIGGDFVCNGDFVPDINQQRDMQERMDNY
jgi:hypothetical protein